MYREIFSLRIGWRRIRSLKCRHISVIPRMSVMCAWECLVVSLSCATFLWPLWFLAPFAPPHIPHPAQQQHNTLETGQHDSAQRHPSKRATQTTFHSYQPYSIDTHNPKNPPYKAFKYSNDNLKDFWLIFIVENTFIVISCHLCTHRV